MFFVYFFAIMSIMSKMSKTFLYIFIFLSENVLYVHSGILCVTDSSPLPKASFPASTLAPLHPPTL